MNEKLPFKFNNPQINICDYRTNNGTHRVFNNIYELLEFVDQFDIKGCFFRGQIGLWNIVSSLYRHFETINWDKAVNICDTVGKWLKLNERLKLIIENDDDRALAVAQHYGCPTDLVDITTDLKTAAYFATENDGKQKDDTKAKENGCIWIFSPYDFELMKMLLEFEFSCDSRHAFDGLPTELISKLSENSFNLLMTIHIPELSRLNAQRGHFLWDIGGILNSLIVKNHIGTRLEFKHCENEQNQFMLEKKRLFPFPNYLESEIMNIMTESSREGGLPNYIGIVNISEIEREGIRKNGVPKEYSDMITDIIEMPSLNDFIPSFGGYKWVAKVNISDITFQNAIDKHRCKQMQLFKLAPSHILPLVSDIIEGLHNNDLTDYLVTLCDLEQPFSERCLYSFENEMFFINPIVVMQNFNYTAQEISEVIHNMIEIIRFLIGRHFGGETISIKFENFIDSNITRDALIKLLTDYYGCKVTLLNIVEGYNFSEFCLPETYQVLDEICQCDFNKYIPNDNLFPKLFKGWIENLLDNAKVFVYQTDPRKIMSYDKAKRLFIDLILPQQFLFHTKGWRVNSPDYLSKIEHPFSGRSHSIIKPTDKTWDDLLKENPITLFL